jgi:hypothetical protein
VERERRVLQELREHVQKPEPPQEIKQALVKQALVKQQEAVARAKAAEAEAAAREAAANAQIDDQR